MQYRPLSECLVEKLYIYIYIYILLLLFFLFWVNCGACSHLPKLKFEAYYLADASSLWNEPVLL